MLEYRKERQRERGGKLVLMKAVKRIGERLLVEGEVGREQRRENIAMKDCQEARDKRTKGTEEERVCANKPLKELLGRLLVGGQLTHIHPLQRKTCDS